MILRDAYIPAPALDQPVPFQFVEPIIAPQQQVGIEAVRRRKGGDIDREIAHQPFDHVAAQIVVVDGE